MKREGAINTLRKFPIGLMDLGSKEKQDITEAIDMALAALRAPTREQVEALRGDWIDKPTGRYGQWQTWCSACGKHSGIGGIKNNRHRNFCPNCGCPQTDEAVEILLKRLEALHENNR